VHFWYLCADNRHLKHIFKATNIEKEVAFEDAFNAKVEVLHLKNELR